VSPRPPRKAAGSAAPVRGTRAASGQRPGVQPGLRPVERPGPARALLARIRLLVLDVDGTLTDGRLYYSKDGEALKAFDVRDGHGLRLLAICGGVKLAVLTGRRADLIRVRCQELGIARVVERSRAKHEALAQLCEELGVPLSRTAFIGDDLNDLGALALAGLQACPADAASEVRSQVEAAGGFVAAAGGGRGAVRELCEALLGATVGWPPPEPAPDAFRT
jgi:3-deoxy-D-manno-octulosonate 8-phosphate phosphatase (KDO 8-P phosphatase)